MATTDSSAPPAHTTDPTTRAGDPFAHAGKRRECPACFGGHVTITLEEDGQEHDEAMACRRCADSR